METNIRKISEYDFSKLEVPILFENELTDRVFGLVSVGTNNYKLGWQSPEVLPRINLIDGFLCSLGIDLTFVVFEVLTGKVLLKLSLDYFLYDIKMHNGFIYAILELEIIKIDIVSLKIVDRYPLPDYFESIEFNEKAIAVKCVNSETIVLQS